jgi:hypothetical protein
MAIVLGVILAAAYAYSQDDASVPIPTQTARPPAR